MTVTADEYLDRLRERSADLAPDDDAHDDAHYHLTRALALAGERVAEVYDPDGDLLPGQPLLDVDLCPDWALPWLAQVLGVALPAGSDPVTARTLIESVAGWQRGTPAAMTATANALLTGTRTIYFRERDSNAADPPYSIDVVTLTSETPDLATLTAALKAQKPAGLVMAVRTVPGQDWQNVKTTQASWNAVKTNFTTWDRLILNQTGP